jgi:quaternary ammonium compound-resistance protein SugE
MAWVALALAGLFECAWAVGLKYTQGFTKPGWSIFTGVAMGASLWLLGIALRTLPLGTAYAIWTGIGAVGTVALGATLLGEPLGPLRLVCVALIVTGMVGLKLATPQ